MIGISRPLSPSAQIGWCKFRIAEYLGPGDHDVCVFSAGPPVRVVVVGIDHDSQDRPTAVIEAYYPDDDWDDFLDWADIWEAVSRQYPSNVPVAKATEAEYQALKESVATFGSVQPVIVDETGNVIAGRLRKRACTELRVNCPTEVIAGLTRDQKEQLAFELDNCRKHLSLADKRRAAEFVLKCSPRNSDRVIGRVVGLDHKTVGTVREELAERGEIPQVEQRQGGDRKTYKFKRIITNSSRELDNALESIDDLPSNCTGKILDPITAKRRAKRNRRRQDRESRVVPELPGDSIRLFHCPFQDLEVVAGIGPATSSLILTDIPYQKEWLAQLPDLAQFAMRVLSDGGLFVTYSGHAYLNTVMRTLEDNGLTYRWMLRSEWKGPANVYHPYNMNSKWLPVLVFSKGNWRKRGRWYDFLPLCPKEKDWHEWQRPIGEIESLVQFFSEPGDWVIEPCGGGFTTAVACHRLSRRCISCDIDGEAVQRGLERLTQERDQLENNS